MLKTDNTSIGIVVLDSTREDLFDGKQLENSISNMF